MAKSEVLSLIDLRKLLTGCVLGGLKGADNKATGLTKNGNISIHFQGYNEETGRASDFIPVETMIENLETLKSEGYDLDDIVIRGGFVISMDKPENSKGKGKGKVKAGKSVKADDSEMEEYLAFQKFQEMRKKSGKK